MRIANNYKKIISSLPKDVRVIVAAKTRTPEEIIQVIEAGAKDIGHNYVQEAINSFSALGDFSKEVNWHMIGHLQKNKINKALEIFDFIQTVDSYDKAVAINKRCDDNIDVLIEINSGDEKSKSGLTKNIEQIFNTVEKIISLNHINLCGLMTMGPVVDNPESLRPFFKETFNIFKLLSDDNELGKYMKILSMGMSDSYKIALEEGSNMVRIGSAIFGPRR